VIGGQEDMIVEVAAELARARDEAGSPAATVSTADRA